MEFASGSRWSACSVAGTARSHNSDAYAVSECDGRLVVAVADGVGALPGSPAASRAAVRAASQWGCTADLGDDGAAAALFAETSLAVRAALAEERLSEGATTLVCAVLHAEGCFLAAVGDSEIIAVGRDGAGSPLNPLDQVPDQPNVLTAWIDGEMAFTPHVSRLEAPPERLCLVSDGVSKGLDYGRIAGVVRDAESFQSARALVEAALASGVGDDITAVVVFPADLG